MTRRKKKTAPTARGIACPTCRGPSKLLYTRSFPSRVVRRRTCAKCGRFTTIERPAGLAEKEKSVGVTTLAVSVTELLKTLGMSPTDLQPFVTLPMETRR